MSFLKDNALRGILYYSLSVFSFCLLGVLVRYLKNDVGVYEIIFVRSAIIGIIASSLLVWRGKISLLKTKKPGTHLMRSLVGVTALFLLSYSYTLMPLSEVTIVLFTNSFFVAILSAYILKEKPTRAQWLAIIVGFCGVLVAFFPNLTSFGIYSIVPLCASFLMAVVAIFLRNMAKTESSEATVFYFALISTAVMGLSYVWFPFQLNLIEFLILVVAGILAYAAQMALTLSFKYAPAPLVAPYQYVSIIWAATFGYFIWGDQISVYLVAGSVIVIGSGLFLIKKSAG